MVALFSKFYGKVWVRFSFNTRLVFSRFFYIRRSLGNLVLWLKKSDYSSLLQHRKILLLWGFILNHTERAQVLLKRVLEIFKIALRLRDQHVFLLQLLKILNVFNTLILRQIFWKTKTFFKKLEYRLLVVITKIESAIFPHKTALSEANVRQIEWGLQNGAITENEVLPGTTLCFWKFCFSLKTSDKVPIRWTIYTNFHIHTFPKPWSFIWGSFFSVSALKSHA